MAKGEIERKCSVYDSLETSEAESKWDSMYQHRYSTVGYPVCKSCYVRMILYDYLKYGLGLPLSHEEHDNLKSKELVRLAERMLTADAEFLKNLDKMSQRR